MRKLALLFAQILIFTIPWETAITISSLGTLTRLVGFGVAGIWAASVLITGKLRKLHVYHVVVLAFLLYNLASIFWTVNLDLTMTRIKTYIQLAILVWILWDLFTSTESIHAAMQVFILGAYMIIASQLFNFISGQTIGAYSAGRYSGAGQNANEFALILSLSLPMAWHLAITRQPGPGANVWKAVNLAFIPLALLATVLTASRTALVTNIPGLLYITVTMRNIRPAYRLLIVLSIITAFVVIWPMIPQATFERLATIGTSITGDELGGRTRLWKGSLVIFMNHPLFGTGSNTLTASDQLGAVAHNTFLSILGELGLVGFLLFLAIQSIVAWQAIKQPVPYAILWVTVIMVWLIGVFTLTWEYTKTTWFFLSLIIMSGASFSTTNQRTEHPTGAAVSLPGTNAPAVSRSQV